MTSARIRAVKSKRRSQGDEDDRASSISGAGPRLGAAVRAALLTCSTAGAGRAGSPAACAQRPETAVIVISYRSRACAGSSIDISRPPAAHAPRRRRCGARGDRPQGRDSPRPASKSAKANGASADFVRTPPNRNRRSRIHSSGRVSSVYSSTTIQVGDSQACVVERMCRPEARPRRWPSVRPSSAAGEIQDCCRGTQCSVSRAARVKRVYSDSDGGGCGERELAEMLETDALRTRGGRRVTREIIEVVSGAARRKQKEWLLHRAQAR